MALQKILVVDDEEKFCKMVKSNLEKTGRFQVQTETKGANVLAAAKAFKPDLVFMDIMIPDLGGCEAAVQIRKEPGFESLPIVFLTAIASKDTTEVFGGIIDGRPFTAKPVLSKPVKTDKLIKAIDDNLGTPQA